MSELLHKLADALSTAVAAMRMARRDWGRELDPKSDDAVRQSLEYAERQADDVLLEYEREHGDDGPVDV